MQTETEHYLTVSELRAMLKISRAGIYRLMAKGLPYLTVGHRRRFLLRQAEAFLRKDVVEPGEYRCGVCQWAGQIAERRYRYGMHCPKCQTVVPPLVRVHGETA